MHSLLLAGLQDLQECILPAIITFGFLYFPHLYYRFASFFN